MKVEPQEKVNSIVVSKNDVNPISSSDLSRIVSGDKTVRWVVHFYGVQPEAAHLAQLGKIAQGPDSVADVEVALRLLHISMKPVFNSMGWALV